MTTLPGVLSSDQITSLISQASTAYALPATALQAQEKPIETQISALGQVQSALSGLQSSLASLADIPSLAQNSVTVSPAGGVTATATNAAAAGTYVLSNIQLATSETLLSSSYSSASSGVGTGTLAFQVGSGSTVTVNISSNQDSLSGIAAAINQAGVGVQANVLFDGTSYHLELTSTGAGGGNSFTVSGSGELTALSYSSGASGTGLTQIQEAADAHFSLNGATITSGSNTISGAVPGLTFNLVASGSATVTVTQDSSALDQAADTVVSALNNALTTINQNASYTTTSGAGPLLGNIGVEVVRTQLLNSITQPVTTGLPAGTPYTSLASIGFSITSNGTVSLNDATFQTAAATDYTAVAALLGNTGSASNANVTVQDASAAQPGNYAVSVSENDASLTLGTVNGEAASGTNGLLVVTGPGGANGLSLQIASGVTGNLGTVSVSQGLFGNLTDILNSALSSGGGGITGEIASDNASITSLNTQISSLQQQAAQETETLTQQFSAAQATLNQLQTVSDFLTTYFSSSGSG
jgi:flagellar hook-associated protein 2